MSKVMSKKQTTFIYGIASVAALALVLAAAVQVWGAASKESFQPKLLALMQETQQAPRQEPSEAAQASEPATGEKAAEKTSGAKSSGEKGGEEGKEESPFTEVYHWINFLIVAGGLGYLVKKALVPFLTERGSLIRRDMDLSRKTMAEAEQRLAAVESKLKHLNDELAALRQAASQEAQAERQRIEEAASADAARVLAAAEQEIDASMKAARQQLKQYAAELAIGVAESKIRASLTPQSEQRILNGFVNDLVANGQAGSHTGKEK